MIINTKNIPKEILISGSKSYANRFLIAAALVNKKIQIHNLPLAADVKHTVDVLIKIGMAERKNDSVFLAKQFPQDETLCHEIIDLDLGEGGTTIRFLLPFLALGKNKYRILVHPRFKVRPHHELLQTLKNLGANIEELSGKDELCFIQGPIQLQDITIDCGQTTQIASAFVLLSLHSKFRLKIKNLNSSHAYIDMSKKVVEMINENDQIQIPVDMSSAGYFIALGLFFQEINIKNIQQKDPYQADSRLFDLLDQMGACYSLSKEGLHISPKQHYQTFNFDISQALDLAPTLCFIAANIEGKSTLKNIKNLRFKESNRINSIHEVLQGFGVKHTIDQDAIEVWGTTKALNSPLNLRVAPDHRIVMMASLFLKINKGGEIHPASVVNKSFPEFFDLLNGIDTIIDS